MDNICASLKDDGVLIIGVPYVFALKYRLLGNKLSDKDAIRWYCKRTLKNLLTKYNFTIIESIIDRVYKNPELIVVSRKVSKQNELKAEGKQDS